MRYGTFMRLGPDLDTEWGTIESPYITRPLDADPTRNAGTGPQIRGRHPYRTEPRPIGVAAMLRADPVRLVDDALDMPRRERASLNPNTPPYAHGVGAEATAASGSLTETRWGFYLLLAGSGVLAMSLLSAATPRPARSRLARRYRP